jgi:hypothetical protein
MPDTTPKTQEEQGHVLTRVHSMLSYIRHRGPRELWEHRTGFDLSRDEVDALIRDVAAEALADHNAAKSLEVAVAALRAIRDGSAPPATGASEPSAQGIASTALREIEG